MYTMAEIKMFPKNESGWSLCPDGQEMFIHPSAYIGDSVHVGDFASIGASVHVGDFAYIGDSVRVGDFADIGASVHVVDFVSIGAFVRIGKGIKLDTSVPYLILPHHSIYWSAPGVIGSASIQKPWAWWNDDDFRNLKMVAKQNNYTSADIDLYIIGFKAVWELSEKMGLNVQSTEVMAEAVALAMAGTGAGAESQRSDSQHGS